MAQPWEAERPEDSESPESMLVDHFGFSEAEARSLQKERKYTLPELREWFRYRRTAFKAEGIKCPSGFVKWQMKEHKKPHQTKVSWWQPKDLQVVKRQMYDKPYKKEVDPEAMTWQEFKRVSKRRYRGGKRADPF